MLDLLPIAIPLSALLLSQSFYEATSLQTSLSEIQREPLSISLPLLAEQDPAGLEMNLYLQPSGHSVQTQFCSAGLTHVFLLQHLLIVFIFN